MPRFVGQTIPGSTEIEPSASGRYPDRIRLTYAQARLLPAGQITRSLDTSDRGSRHQRAKRWYRWYAAADAILAAPASTPLMRAAVEAAREAAERAARRDREAEIERAAAEAMSAWLADGGAERRRAVWIADHARSLAAHQELAALQATARPECILVVPQHGTAVVAVIEMLHDVGGSMTSVAGRNGYTLPASLAGQQASHDAIYHAQE